jgi:hypothetical protein
MRNLIFPAIRLLLLGLILAAAVLSTPFQATAQADVTRLTELAVELWPDYDRPSVLVLLTGALPEDAALPTTLSIPYPAGAEVHAVASFNEAGALMSDVDYSAANGLLTLTTPSARFRVEYYAPYTVNGDEYTFTFEWTSPLVIDEMTTVVQQPVAATDFRVTPAPVGSATRGDGLTYHTLEARPVAANEPVTVELAYTVEAPVLSAPSQVLRWIQPVVDRGGGRGAGPSRRSVVSGPAARPEGVAAAQASAVAPGPQRRGNDHSNQETACGALLPQLRPGGPAGRYVLPSLRHATKKHVEGF